MTDRDRHIWNQIADHWDEQIGEGNDFQKLLIMPATDRLLDARAGQLIVDACCGNGNYARQLGRGGANVIAFDGSSSFIDIARKRTLPADGEIGYHVADACDETAISVLAPVGDVDSYVCS